MVAHGLHQGTECHLLLRLGVERHLHGVVLTIHVWQIFVHAVDEAVEEAPHTGVAIADATEIERIIGITERKLLVGAREIAFLAGELHHVLSIEHIFFVLHVETCDSALVGMGANAVVRYSDCYPHGTLAARSLAHHFHDPSFILVGDGEGLALTEITVFSHERGHDVDGIAGRGGTFQGDINEGAVVNTPFRVGQFLSSSESGLRDGDLILVHLPHHVVGAACLVNRAEKFVGVPVEDRTFLILGMHSPHMAVHIAIHTV